MGRYDDLLDLPHPVSKTHPQMSIQDRAAQFSPFAALTGYQSVLRETARLTHRRVELTEEERAALDQRLRLAVESGPDAPPLTFTYFRPDEKKDGGAYLTVTGTIKKLDKAERAIQLRDGTRFPLENLYAIDGAWLRTLVEME